MASFTHWSGKERAAVSMGGARSNETHREKMLRLRREREGREQERGRVEASKKLQSWARGCVARQRCQRSVAAALDALVVGEAPADPAALGKLCGLFALLTGPRRAWYLPAVVQAGIAPTARVGFASQCTSGAVPIDVYQYRCARTARAAVEDGRYVPEVLTAVTDPAPFAAAGRHDLYAGLQDRLAAMGAVTALARSGVSPLPVPLLERLLVRRPQHPDGGFTAGALPAYLADVFAAGLGTSVAGEGLCGALFGYPIRATDEAVLQSVAAALPAGPAVAEGVLGAVNRALPLLLAEQHEGALLPLLPLLSLLVSRASPGWLNRSSNGLVMLQTRFGVRVLAAAQAKQRVGDVVAFYSRILQRTSDTDARLAVLSVAAFSEGFIPLLLADVTARGALCAGAIGDPIEIPDRACPGDGVDALYLFLIATAHFLDCSHIDDIMAFVDLPALTKVVLNLAVRSIFHDGSKPLCEAILLLARKLNDWNARRAFLPPKDWIVDYPWPTQVTLKDWRAQSVGSPVFRTFSVLQNIPFIIPFETRVLMFRNFVDEELQDHVLQGLHWTTSHTVRRGHIFEDGFRAIYRMSPMELRVKARVTFIDREGNEEEGFGDGVFKEFLSELIKVVFDPSHALFLQTDANELYPNPFSAEPHVYGDDAFDRYRFIGRVIGKALYEGILIQLPLARFFRNLMLERSNCLHDLPSLDPELHKNLVQLRSMKPEDVDALGLVFAVDVDKLGVSETVEFFPGGADVPVTGDTRMKYIHLMAHLKLTRMIQRQAAAVREGLQDVLSPSWLKMFDSNELQTLLCGYQGSADLDVEDWEAHTIYGGGYSAEDHTVKLFWQAVRELSPDDQRRLLKFVTSVDRAPLLGFKYLNPQFCVHKKDAADAGLPSASTCINLLKLPTYANKGLMREKLMWVVSHDTGFGFS